MNLYNKNLTDHYHNPRNYRKLDLYDLESSAFNPLCGDKITLQLKLDHNLISEIGFQGEGCIISLATASILFEKCVNKTLENCTSITEKDIESLIKLNLGPNRLKCALLSLEALKLALKTKNKKNDA